MKKSFFAVSARYLLLLACLLNWKATLNAQWEADSLITPDYFGFDFWSSNKNFWAEVYLQMNNDNFPFGLVGSDAINWQKIEPEPPQNGQHDYNWGPLDTIMWYTQLAGKKLDLGIRPLSNWGTVMPADSSSDWAVDMSALLPDSLCPVDQWGMTAHQAWADFVYALVERYDGDSIGNPNTPYISSSLIKTLGIGNEIEAPGHFFDDSLHQKYPGGSVEKLQEIFALAYDTAKLANPDIIILRGKSNPGYIFDDQPDTAEVYERRAALFDSLRKDFLLVSDFYDMLAINYNDHYNSLPGYAEWLRLNMQNAGIEKPLSVGDARTTLFPRDNFYLDNPQQAPFNIMPQIYDSSIVLLPDPSLPEYEALKAQWQKDKVMQSIKKLALAGASGQFQISLQPVYVPADFNLGSSRTYMWMYSGFFDPYIYESQQSLAPAREPLYWSAKMFAEEVMGANKQAEVLALGEHIHAYRYLKQDGPNPLIAWHEDPFRIDPNMGLLQRQQDTLFDMTAVFNTPYVLIKHFYTETDEDGMPIEVPDTIVAVSSVPLNEFPVILYPSEVSSTAHVEAPEELRFNCFPNPAKRHISLNTDIQEAFMLELTTAEGRILQQWHIDRPQPQTVLSLPELPAGLYFLRMECNGKTTSRRLIVK